MAAEERVLTLGHSPDSDDAFMFYGLASGQVRTEGFRFEHILRDIQTLNDWAKQERLDSTAVSVHAYAYLADKYALLNHGASMGDGYGPIVVAREAFDPSELGDGRTVAVPGLLTSAYLALRLYVGTDFTYVVMPFDEIMDAVKNGDVAAGLLIHEGQLTHEAEGLTCVVDLGLWWREETGLPLPLGVNLVRRALGPDLQAKVSAAMKASIVYGLEHRAASLDHAMQYARDLDPDLADRFVGMYVNDYTVDLGKSGQDAIRLFLKRGHEIGLLPTLPDIQFVD